MKSDSPLSEPISLLCDQPTNTIPAMTIGIGVICESGKSVVVVADRWTTGADANFDVSYAKIQIISPRVLVVSAGIKHEITHVMEGMHDEPESTVKEFAERLRQSREAMRSKHVATIVNRRLGMDFSKFVSLAAAADSSLYREVSKEIANVSLAMNLLVAGVDDSGAHLFHADEFPVPARFDDQGFTAIGSGSGHATPSLARQRYRPSCNLAEGVFSAYCAKRAAEFGMHVGGTTDVAIIRSGESARFLSKAALKELRVLFRETSKASQLNRSQCGRIAKHLE